jgi:PAS domain S-box-containing protein
MSEVDFRRLVESSLDVIVQVSPQGIIQYTSPSSLAVLGWAPEEMVGQPPRKFVHPDDYQVVASAMDTLFQKQAEDARTVVRNIRRDGSIGWVETTARVMRDPQAGEDTPTVLILRDVTERKELEVLISAEI